jgi:hypothetical protein
VTQKVPPLSYPCPCDVLTRQDEAGFSISHSVLPGVIHPFR